MHHMLTPGAQKLNRDIILFSGAMPVRATYWGQVGALCADHCRRENGVAAPPPR